MGSGSTGASHQRDATIAIAAQGVIAWPGSKRLHARARRPRALSNRTRTPRVAAEFAWLGRCSSSHEGVAKDDQQHRHALRGAHVCIGTTTRR